MRSQIALSSVVAALSFLNGSAFAVPPGPMPPIVATWSATDLTNQRNAVTNPTTGLRAKINNALNNSTVNISKGDYRFATFANAGDDGLLEINGKDDVTIDFHGSTIWCEKGVTALDIGNCQSVTIKNLVIDYAKLPFIQGTVTTVGTSTCTVQLDPGYENMSDEMKSAPNVQNASIRFQVLDKATYRFKRYSTGMQCNNFFAGTSGTGPFTVTVNPFGSTTMSQANIAVGDPFVCMYRNVSNHAVYHSGCTSMRFENVTLRASPFIGFVEEANKGQTTYLNCKIVPDGSTNRHLAGNADGFNSQNCQFGPILDTCEIDSIGDDFFNPHGVYSRVLFKLSSTDYQVDKLSSQDYGLKDEFVNVTVLARPFWSKVFSGTCKVTNFGAKGTGEEYIYHQASSILKTDPLWMAGQFKHFPNESETLSVHTVQFPAGTPTLPNDSIICCNTYCSTGAQVRNCRFINGLAIGIRCQSADSVIESNHIEWTISDLVRLTVQPDDWGDAMSADRGTVKNNLLVNTDMFSLPDATIAAAIAVLTPGDSMTQSPSPILAPDIHNNIIRGYVPIHAIYIGGAEQEGTNKVKVNGNTIEGYGQAIASSFTDGTVPGMLLGYGLYSFYAVGLEYTNPSNTYSGAGALAGSTPSLIVQ